MLLTDGGGMAVLAGSRDSRLQVICKGAGVCYGWGWHHPLSVVSAMVGTAG